MTIQELAAEMNMPLADVSAFVSCLSVWTAKGYTVEQAIERHMAQMTRLANNAVAFASSDAGREMAISAFYPEN
jgi:predicted RNA-binding protein with PIN domain